MRYVYGLLTGILFFAVLGFAVKNAELVTLQYYLGLSWSAPLVLIVLACFALGVACGVLASLGLVVRQRREANAIRQELAALNNAHPSTPETL
jgi:uncharacterized integral membrane protein